MKDTLVGVVVGLGTILYILGFIALVGIVIYMAIGPSPAWW